MLRLKNRTRAEAPGADATPPQKNLARPSAEEIYTQVATNARQELKRSTTSLGISGFGGGAFMGLSALGPAIVIAMLGQGGLAQSALAWLVASMFYPVGFIVVIIGRSQLFTENTLYPVALVLAEKREILNTLRLWAVVLPANIAGTLAFAVMPSFTPAFDPAVVNAMSELGLRAIAHPPATIFWSGVIGGWMIALAAWLVSGSHSITGSVMVIWMLTFIVGLGNFAHCVASSCEILVV